jgi:hypothetical protein
MVRQLLEQLGMQLQLFEPIALVNAGDVIELLFAEVQACPGQVAVVGADTRMFSP